MSQCPGVPQFPRNPGNPVHTWGTFPNGQETRAKEPNPNPPPNRPKSLEIQPAWPSQRGVLRSTGSRSALLQGWMEHLVSQQPR